MRTSLFLSKPQNVKIVHNSPINRRIICTQRGRQLQRLQKCRTVKFGRITRPRNFEAAARLSHHRRPLVTKIIWQRIEFGP